jgi:acylphosphatase
MFALSLSIFLTTPTAPDDKPSKACVVHYTGKVQGVGFRATTADIARDYPVTGWVKNLADGRVQLLVEGPEDAVDKFLKAVHTRWKDNIEKEEVEKRTVTGKFKTFEVAK